MFLKKPFYEPVEPDRKFCVQLFHGVDFRVRPVARERGAPREVQRDQIRESGPAVLVEDQSFPACPYRTPHITPEKQLGYRGAPHRPEDHRLGLRRVIFNAWEKTVINFVPLPVMRVRKVTVLEIFGLRWKVNLLKILSPP
jgi:hypothetical protein